ncbi:MAG: hypothetical protein JWP07_83, partial [Pseudonocardiales bacterium]|nr:hypothetical protein [Pseudonocardiales bacterium]
PQPLADRLAHSIGDHRDGLERWSQTLSKVRPAVLRGDQAPLRTCCENAEIPGCTGMVRVAAQGGLTAGQNRRRRVGSRSLHAMSLDGFIAGPNETDDNGLGDGGSPSARSPTGCATASITARSRWRSSCSGWSTRRRPASRSCPLEAAEETRPLGRRHARSGPGGPDLCLASSRPRASVTRCVSGVPQSR